MPHVAITMYPGRDRKIKAALAEKVQKCVAEELGVDQKVISVSIEDVAKENWDKSLERFPADSMFIKEY
jgi:4-oxalocrotonate tautomerase